jgi:transposase
MKYCLFAGIDVSLNDLVVACCDQEEVFISECSFANTAAGIRKLIAHLSKLGAMRVCLEPTSCYHLAVLAKLAVAPQLETSVVNPRAARDFARASMIRGKTDRVDAKVLARYALHFKPAPYTPPRQVALELRAISRRISTLVVDRVAERNRLHAAKVGRDPRCILKSIEVQLKHLTQQIEALQANALELIQHDEQLQACYKLLLSIKGIGVRSAVLILGELGVLPVGLSKAQWVAMSGLDPKPQESGKADAPRQISRQGNCALRRALFMPALSAASHAGAARDYYLHLLGRNKRPLQALVALMRKFICAIWGMFRSNMPFDQARFYRQGA